MMIPVSVVLKLWHTIGVEIRKPNILMWTLVFNKLSSGLTLALFLV